MYVLSDFFIATPAEQSARDMSRSPVLTLPTILGRGVDAEKVLYLHTIVDGTFDPKRTAQAVKDFLSCHPPCFPADVQLLPYLVEGLAGLCDLHRQQCADQWASLDGWECNGVTPEQVKQLFMDVADLARDALITGRTMYVWICELPRRES